MIEDEEESLHFFGHVSKKPGRAAKVETFTDMRLAP
jgi:hypothetical protein